MSYCELPGKDTPVFSRNMSHMVKGVAILMMIAHHCFAFPDYWLDTFRTSPFLAEICNHFKICVAMFAFITGYGFYAGNSVSYKRTLWKVLDFLSQYWVQLFLIFLPVASIRFSFSADRILYNMFALYDNIILFAWYVFFHCLVLLTFPFVRKALKKGPVWDLAVVLAGGYCFTVMFYFQPFEAPLFTMLMDCSIYYPVVGMGYLAAKYSVFDRVSRKIAHKFPTSILLIGLVFFLRSKISVFKGFTFDTIYAPTLILTLSWILGECRFLHSGLTFLGKHSFHMWLFHAIFFSAYTREVVQPIVAWIDAPILCFLMITILSAVAAFVIDAMWRHLMQMLCKCKKENLQCT